MQPRGLAKLHQRFFIEGFDFEAGVEDGLWPAGGAVTVGDRFFDRQGEQQCVGMCLAGRGKSEELGGIERHINQARFPLVSNIARISRGQAIVASQWTSAWRPPSSRLTNLPHDTPSV